MFVSYSTDQYWIEQRSATLLRLERQTSPPGTGGFVRYTGIWGATLNKPQYLHLVGLPQKVSGDLRQFCIYGRSNLLQRSVRERNPSVREEEGSIIPR